MEMKRSFAKNLHRAMLQFEMLVLHEFDDR